MTSRLETIRLMERFEEDTNRWKDIYHAYGLEESSLKCPYYTKKSMDSFSPYQNSNGIFFVIQNNSEICVESPETLNSQNLFFSCYGMR